MMIEEIVELRFIASRRACASGLSWACRLITKMSVVGF